MGGAAAAIVPQGLGLDVLERLVDGGQHVGGFRQPDQVSAAPLHRDFRDVAVLLDGQDDLALEVFTQNFGELGEAEFDLTANRGSNFVLSAQVLYVH